MARSRRLVAIGLGLPLAYVALAGLLPSCADDFDSLFGAAAPLPSEAGAVTDAGGDAIALDSSPGVDAAGIDAGCIREGGCPLPTESCSGGTCTYGCTGCGCGCAQTCKKSDTINSCAASCGPGTTCGVTCTGAGPCTSTCAAGASCILTCGGASSCNLDCPGGTKKSCPGGVLTCDHPCP